MTTIQDVLKANQQDLMSRPGVIGVYVGLDEAGQTPCLKVIVDPATPQAHRELPRKLGDFRVLIEASDPIRPLPDEGGHDSLS